MSWWTELRDAVESVGVLAGNYFLPGSSLITSNLVSEGSQEQLGSDLGRLAQLGTGAGGAMTGQLANYGNLAQAAGASDSTLQMLPASMQPGVTTGSELAGFNPTNVNTSAATVDAAGNIVPDWTKSATAGGATGSNTLMASLKTPLGALAGVNAISGLVSAAQMKQLAGIALTQQERDALAQQRLMDAYMENQKSIQPVRNAADIALLGQIGNSITMPVAPNVDSMTTSPEFRARLLATQRLAASRGQRGSGNETVAAANTGSDWYQQAFTNYQNQLNQYQQQQTNFMGMAGTGQGGVVPQIPSNSLSTAGNLLTAGNSTINSSLAQLGYGANASLLQAALLRQGAGTNG